MATQPRTSQIKSITATPMIGSAIGDTLNTIVDKIDAELSKLFEDRNFLLADGGTITVNAGATSVTFSASLKLHVNSLVSGASPSVIDLTATTRSFSSDGRMLYAVINRIAATATITADSIVLPAVTSTNQEVVLIAKRIGTSIYFRNGVIIPASATRTMDGNTFSTNNLTINSTEIEGISTDSATTGANTTLSTPTTPIVRLTNASLISIDMLAAGASGQQQTIMNVTGTSITLNNLTGGTAANQFITGTGANLSIASNASIIIKYDGTSSKWRVIGGSGSGSGSNGINYILSPSADSGSVGYITYADAAGTSPVDGTGGSPAVTFTTTTSAPIRGTTSFLITKDAVNRQGEGVSYDFTIDAADKGKVLQGSFEYQIASGTFADNDISIWVYDITNARMIQPAPYLLKNSGLIEKFPIEFQTSIDSTSYRLIFHVASTSALAYTIKMDSISVGPTAKLYGSAVTDWVTYTPIWTAASVNPTIGDGTISGKYRRVGDSMEIETYIQFGSTSTKGTGEYRLSIPSGFSVDASKLPGPIQLTTVGMGTYLGQASVLNTQVQTVFLFDSTTFRAATDQNSVTNTFSSNQAGVFTTTNDNWSTTIRVPIVGWSSSTIMSSDADTRVTAATLSGTPTGTISVLGSSTIAKFPTVVGDSHGAYNTSTGLYTVPVTGIYSVEASALLTFTSGTPYLYAQIYKNGVAYKSQYFYQATASDGVPKVTGDVPCIAGDTIGIYFSTNAASPVFSGAAPTNNQFTIKRISGPAQIAASESVVAIYSDSSGQVFPATTTYNALTFNTKIKDSHSSFNGATGIFTAPISGTYALTLTVGAFNSLAAANAYQDFIANSSSGEGVSTRMDNSGASRIVTSSMSKTFQLLAGQTITLTKGATYSTGTYQLFNSGGWNALSITRTGNY